MSDLDRLLARHTSFWELRDSKDVLLARVPHPNWRPRPYPVAGGGWIESPRRIEPASVDVDRLLGLDGAPEDLTCGDMIRPVRTVFPVSWMESLLGCPIFVSAYSCSAKPVAAGEPGITRFSMRDALASPWLPVMDRVVRREVEAAAGTRPAGQLHLRGVVDMLAAYLGEEKLCTSLYDEPRQLERLAASFARLYIEVARRGLAMRPPWNGGYTSVWGVHAPGDLVDYQMDASSLISPELYRRHISRYDEMVLQEFSYSVLHLHACGMHLVDTIGRMRGVRAVEITLERETGKWDKDRIVAACRLLKDMGKPLLLSGELSEREADEMREEIGAGALAIFHWLPARPGHD